MSFEEAPRPVSIRARGLTKAFAIYERPALRLKQLLWPGKRKFHDEFIAVQGVDLEIFSGETVGIVGRNGSGKSTLLNLICGTLERTSGALEITGNLAPILSLGAGFDPEFTGRENILMNAAIFGLSRAEINKRLDSIMNFADIGEFFDLPVKLYSSGMYARLAFSAAINSNPEIMVIDEILSVGDEAFSRKCFARIEQLKASGSTILFVSHSSQMVIELCDRAILLEGGIPLLTAKPRDVVAYYHKLLYVSEESRASLVEEIREYDRNGRSKPVQEVDVPDLSIKEKSQEILDPDLRPESTSEYERLGAHIHGVQILNVNGAAVNVLSPGGEYTYVYDVDFSEDAYAVQFGMMIKSPTGLEIAGQVSHAPSQLIEHVPAGHSARVGLPFRALLAPGTYFVNAGVMGIRIGEKVYLHRILDALAFRIDPGDEDRTTGRVDLTAPGNWSKISPTTSN